MAESILRLIKRSAEFISIDEVGDVPKGRRGLYVLYKRRPKAGIEHFDVVYVGMARNGMLARLISHTKTKQREWTHFSVFEVWDNVRDEEIVELEGLFRHLYRRDSKANSLNKQKKFHKAFKVRQNDFSKWTKE
jgi:hypothetical protein